MSASMKGTYNHNLDAKGRVIIPSKIREALGKEFVVTRGFENCLSLYSKEEWNNLTEKLKGLGNKKEAVRNLKRYIQANAADCEIDTQGRTVIPPQLRETVGLEKEIVIVGNGEKAEIWSKKAWDELMSAECFSVENLKAQLEELDIEF